MPGVPRVTDMSASSGDKLAKDCIYALEYAPSLRKFHIEYVMRPDECGLLVGCLGVLNPAHLCTPMVSTLLRLELPLVFLEEERVMQQ